MAYQETGENPFLSAITSPLDWSSFARACKPKGLSEYENPPRDLARHGALVNALTVVGAGGSIYAGSRASPRDLSGTAEFEQRQSGPR